MYYVIKDKYDGTPPVWEQLEDKQWNPNYNKLTLRLVLSLYLCCNGHGCLITRKVSHPLDIAIADEDINSKIGW